MVNVNLEGALPFLGADGPDYAAAERAHRTLFGRSGAGSEFTGWLDLPRRMADTELNGILAAADRIRTQGDALLVVGIGGSYLGARAAIELLKSASAGRPGFHRQCHLQVRRHAGAGAGLPCGKGDAGAQIRR